jgi:hypothetical protein
MIASASHCSIASHPLKGERGVGGKCHEEVAMRFWEDGQGWTVGKGGFGGVWEKVG